ncbi:MAG TPA: flagellar motor switch protein FliM [Geminicoccaceae bacterium]|nr:flagellar motor switch protein FliM [Geminicoccus sp.]HMU48200.1 flagellar motor switch protein FliM [Geminicoccaceae bacterium]
MAAEWAAMAGIGAGGPADDGGDLAADWATLAGGESEPPSRNAPAGRRDGGPPAPGSGKPAVAGPSGLGTIVNSSDISYERLPMLEVVFDRLERILTTSVRNFTSENVDVSLESVTAQRFGDYLNAVPAPAMIAVFRAVEWDNFGLVTVDSSMIYSIVDVLLGGRRGTIPMRIEGRPYTTIEASLIERLVRLILSDLGSAFAPITPVQFRFERMETNPRFAAIARPSNACVVVKLRLEIEDRGGCVECLIPYATMEPARDLLLQMFMGEKFGRDSIWEHHLAREIWVTDVDLEAVLDEQTVSLSDIMELKVGSVLRLNAKPDEPIVLRCGQVRMLTGKVGQRGDKLVIRVEERLGSDGDAGHD